MKFLKITGIAVLSIVILVYLSILFVVPNIVSINKFKPEIQKLAKEQANLAVDFDNAKIIVTPLLSAGVKVDNLSVKLPDNSDLFKTDLLTGRISLPHLISKTVKVTNAEVVNPVINIDITDGKEYKIVRHFETLPANEKEQEVNQPVQQDSFDMSSIKIKVPEIKILNYSLLVNDLKTKDYLKLRGDELLLSYNNGKKASIKTIAELFVNENKNIIANIDIDTFLPNQNTAENNEETISEQQEMPFINPVAVYKSYNLKTNIESKLKIREKDNKIVSKGYFNVDNLTLMLSGIQLPESKLHVATNDTKVNADTELYITDKENISVKAAGDYGKNSNLNMEIKSNEIHIDNVLQLARAALNSANVKNELDTIKGTGYFLADTKFNTDFKKLNSNGSITFKDIDIKDSKTNSRIAKINSLISLDNSVLKFVDTTLEVLNTMFTVDGTINEKSFADINLVMNKMPLEKAFSLFLPKEITKDYSVKSGIINLKANLKGELKALQGKVNLNVNNLSVKDNINDINYLNNLFTADFESDFKTFKGTVNNNDFKLTMNGANVNCDKFSLEVGDKDIIINPSLIKINNSTNIDIAGTVKDYINNPVFNIDGKGALKTADLKQLLGSEIAIYLKDKGTLPLLVNVTGDAKKQTIEASINADSGNYITPIDIASVLNKNTIIKTVIDIQDNKLTLRDTGFFAKDGDNKTEIVNVEGTISKLDTKNPVINTVKIRIPGDISVTPVVFPQSKLNAKGEVIVSGDLNNPKIRGDFNISNVSIPELYLTLEKAVAKFEDKNLDIELKKLIANGSDFNIVMSADLTPSTNFTVKTLNLISNFMDADKLMKVSEALEKYTTPASTGGSVSTAAQKTVSSPAPADIPVIVKDGSIDIKELKSGEIKLTETSGKISMAKNIFYINNLITSAFQGKIKGDVSMNLVTSEIKAEVKGNGLDVEKTLLEAAAMKDTLTGTMDFDANIALKGATYEEQVKTLKGNVNFNMKDGSLGPLGKIENLVNADNISSTSAIKTLISTALTSTVDTSKYNTLNGHLNFDKGIAQINPITSSGDYMSTYIFGNFDVLKNNADLKLRGKLGSRVTDSMGQLAMLNPVNIIKSSSSMNMLLGNLMLTMCEKVTDSELNQIPAVAKETSDENTAKFQIVIRGDAAKPLKLVRSFKWLATENQIKEAKEFLATQSVLSVPTNLNEVKQQAKDILKNLTSEGTSQTNQQAKEALNTVKSLLGGSSSSSTDSKENTSSGTSLKNQLKQVQSEALKQLVQQQTEKK